MGRFRILFVVFVGIVAAGMMLSPIYAVAQESAQQSAEDESEQQPEQQPVAESEDQSRAIEEVIVTAQKRDQSVVKVPITVSVVDDAFISDIGATKIEDIIPFVPAVSGTTFGGSTSLWAIRGMSTTAFDDGSEPSVGTYMDEGYIGRNYWATVPTFDVARIEVTKGPQGTLFGRNTVAGAISVYTNRPSLDGDSLYARVGAGNEDQGRAEVRANVRVSDKFALRFAGLYDQLGDYATNAGTGGTPIMGYSNYGLRLGGLWQASDSVDVFAYYERAELRYNQWCWDNEGITGDTDPDVCFGPLEETTDDFIADSGHLEVGWSINDRLSLKSLTEYRDGSYLFEEDVTGMDRSTLAGVMEAALGLPIDTALYAWAEPLSNQTFFQEVRLSYAADSFFGVMGVNYWSEDIASPMIALQLGVDEFGIRQVDKIGDIGETTSYAFYADGSLDIGERFTLSAGLRWTRDEKDWTSFATSDIHLLPEPNADVPVDIQTTLGLPMIPGAGCEGAFLAPCIPAEGLSDSRSWQELTPRIAFSYSVADDVNLYGGFSQGYKAGGFNTATDGEQVLAFDPETVNAVELGVKGNVGGRRVGFGIAGFFNKYDDMQVQTIVDVLIFTQNAAKAETKGIETELTWLATDNLEFRANYTYVNAEYTEGELSGVPAEGLRLPLSPDHTATVGFNYTAGLGNWGDLKLFTIYSWQSDQDRDIFNSPAMLEDAYGLWDLRVTIGPKSGKWDVSLVGDNILGETYLQHLLDPLGLGPASIYNPTVPIWRLEFGVFFGN